MYICAYNVEHLRIDLNILINTLLNIYTWQWINKTTYIIDIAVPGDANVHQKHIEKIEKYTPLAQEIKRIWKQDKIVIVPIIISTTGITPKTFIHSLEQLDLPLYIHSNIQKSVVLSTSTIVRKFLQQI